MKRLLQILILIVCLLAVLPLAAQDDDVLTVDASTSLGAISPLVYGANHGPWASLVVDTFPQVKVSGIRYLRFPGGNWGDENDLRPEQIDLFMLVVKMLEAEPSIHVRLFNGTPEAAAEIVRYTNIEKEYNVRYWSIGNEPNLLDDYTIEELNAQWRPIAEAMLEVDPNIIFVGPDVSQYPPNPAEGAEYYNWVSEFLKVNGDLIGVVAVHRYPYPRGQAVTTVENLRSASAEWDVIIPHLRELIQESTGRDIPIGITEVNSHWSNATGGEAGMDSHYNAIWWADSLGRIIKQKVEIVAYFTLATAGNQGSWGLFGGYDLRPTYYVYQIYQRFGTELFESSSTDPNVTIYAAKREDGTLTLVVINLGDDEVSKTLSLSGFEPGGDAEVWLFDAEHNAEMIGTEAIADGASVTLPGQSITLYVIPAS